MASCVNMSADTKTGSVNGRPSREQDPNPLQPEQYHRESKKLNLPDSTYRNHASSATTESLPGQIESMEQQLHELEQQISEPDFYQQEKDVIASTLASMDTMREQLAQAYQRWETLDTI